MRISSFLLPLAILAALPTCSTVSVPPPVAPVPCAREPEPVFPALRARACGPDVCIPVDAAGALYEYARAVTRWIETARLCLDTKESP